MNALDGSFIPKLRRYAAPSAPSQSSGEANRWRISQLRNVIGGDPEQAEQQPLPLCRVVIAAQRVGQLLQSLLKARRLARCGDAKPSFLLGITMNPLKRLAMHVGWRPNRSHVI
jgi:hypothetical protein